MDYSSTMQLNLINDLMDLAKMKHDTLKFDNDYFDMRKLVEDALGQVRFSAK